MRDRGLSPVIGKALELAIGLALIAVVTTVMLSTVIPAHTEALGEPTAAVALDGLAEVIERTGWAAPSTVGSRRITVELPATVAGYGYRIEAQGGGLRMHHPTAALALRRPLALPRGCVVEGDVTGGPVAVAVTRTSTECRILLGDARAS